MPIDDHNRTADYTPPSESPPDPNGETMPSPDESGPVTVSHWPDADSPPVDPGTATFSPHGRAAAVPGELPAIPGYAVEAEIARGGMGVVYRARHLRLNRPAAIKMILGGKYHDPTARVRFLVEAEAVAALDHPHVVHVHEFGTHDNLPFFALEYVGGGTLAEKLKRDGKPASRASAEVVVKLADAIAAAHAKGDRPPRPEAGEHLADGVRRAEGGGLRSGEGGAVGHDGDGRGDGYAELHEPGAGGGADQGGGHGDGRVRARAILYELLTGRPPFLGQSSMATIQQVLTREPDRPRTLDGAIPRDLETICLKCLAKEPGKRYGTAAELAADLRAYLDGRPITARPVGTPERAWKWVRRNPVVTGAAVAVVLALTAGTTVSYLKYLDAEQQKGFAQRDQKDAETQKARAEGKEREAKDEADKAKKEAEKARKAREFLVSIFRKAETDVKGVTSRSGNWWRKPRRESRSNSRTSRSCVRSWWRPSPP